MIRVNDLSHAMLLFLCYHKLSCFYLYERIYIYIYMYIDKKINIFVILLKENIKEDISKLSYMLYNFR